jgi:hypothetical protein
MAINIKFVLYESFSEYVFRLVFWEGNAARSFGKNERLIAVQVNAVPEVSESVVLT